MKELQIALMIMTNAFNSTHFWRKIKLIWYYLAKPIYKLAIE